MSSQQRPVIDSLQSSDHIYTYDNLNGFTAVASLATLISFLNGKVSVQDGKATQYSAPAVDGALVTLPSNSQSIWLVITPTASFAAMTIQLPAAAFAMNNQEITITCTQDVAALSIISIGATTYGLPTVLTTVNGSVSFTVRFEFILKRWYRVD